MLTIMMEIVTYQAVVSPNTEPNMIPSTASTTTGKTSLIPSTCLNLGASPRSVPRVTLTPRYIPSVVSSYK